MNFDKIFQKIIVFSFGLMFFLVPLFFTSINSELFEFNKMILVYGFTILIIGSWISRMLTQRKIIFRRTPFDIPLILFLLSQVLSTVFSIDPHTSIFGYYSRFNGGLLSTISYLLLFWALVSNCQAKNVIKFIKVTLASAAIVSIYGILEHFGHSFSCLMFTGQFDVSCWIQDVKSRVFATIGQPNWLATYLSLLLPILLGFAMKMNHESRIMNNGQKKFAPIVLYSLFIILTACLLFTASRSGFTGLIVGLAIFWFVMLWVNKTNLKSLLKPFLILNSSFLILIFVFGSPFAQINRYFSLSTLKPLAPNVVPFQRDEVGSAGPALEVGGSESGEIRKIVWKGAIDIFKHYPIFGSGVETFAYSYYNFRPMEHNLVSEWDFLYNKAHNEYLNYLATTGIVGLGTYLFFICSFVIWTVKRIKKQESRIKEKNQDSLFIIQYSLFAGWLSILVSNFFGFSVVVVSLYFFLIPAFCLVLSFDENFNITPNPKTYNLKPIPFLFLLLVVCYLLSLVINLWRADYFYSLGSKYNKQNQFLDGYQNLYLATNIFPKEPIYLGETANSIANLALINLTQKNSSAAAELALAAEQYSNSAIKISPKNLSLWKNRVKVFYLLSYIDPKYDQKTLDTLFEAQKIAPTDPKIVLNLGLVYLKIDKKNEGIAYLLRAIEMKPNYEEAHNSLGTIYEESGQKAKALEQFEYIFKNIRPNDQELKAKIEKLKSE